jgi:hypothetical protein
MKLPGSRQDDDDGYPLAATKIAVKTLAASLLLATLSGCALLRSQVAVLHQLPEDFSGTTYVMIPFKEQEGRPAHKAYEEALRQELNAKGFRETTLDQAETVVFFAYGIDKGKKVVSSYPIIGQTGVETCSTFDGTLCFSWPTYGSCGNAEDKTNSIHTCLETRYC